MQDGYHINHDKNDNPLFVEYDNDSLSFMHESKLPGCQLGCLSLRHLHMQRRKILQLYGKQMRERPGRMQDRDDIDDDTKILLNVQIINDFYVLCILFYDYDNSANNRNYN